MPFIDWPTKELKRKRNQHNYHKWAVHFVKVIVVLIDRPLPLLKRWTGGLQVINKGMRADLSSAVLDQDAAVCTVLAVGGRLEPGSGEVLLPGTSGGTAPGPHRAGRRRWPSHHHCGNCENKALRCYEEKHLHSKYPDIFLTSTSTFRT